MRFGLVLVGALLLGACGGTESSESTGEVESLEQGVGGGPAIVRFCNSHKSKQLCPKTVCAWYPTANGGGFCDIPATR